MLKKKYHKEVSDLQTPCYIFDCEEFARSYRSLSSALSLYFDDYVVGYSVKTNSMSAVLDEAQSLGIYAEVVSYDEYKLVKEHGFAAVQIIYNGPLKSFDTFVEALDGGAIVNIDTPRQIEWLKRLPKEGIFKVGLRLSINLSEISPGDAEYADDSSRFGFSVSSGSFKEAIETIKTLDNVRLAGLHVHRTTKFRRPLFYRRLTEYACNVIRQFGLRPEYLDIGGGFYGIRQGKPAYKDYIQAIFETLKSNDMENIRLVVEPGNGLIDSPISFVCSVIDVNDGDYGNRIVFTDGSRIDVDPHFRKTNYLKSILLNDDYPRPTLRHQTVCGCTCIENDRIFVLDNHPELKIGDRILFDNTGAYTCAFTPNFIRKLPDVHIVNKDNKLL